MNITMKILNLIIGTTLLYSCVSTQKYANYVNLKYAQQNQTSIDNSYIEYENNNHFDSIVRTKKIKSFFIPALVYW